MITINLKQAVVLRGLFRDHEDANIQVIHGRTKDDKRTLFAVRDRDGRTFVTELQEKDSDGDPAWLDVKIRTQTDLSTETLHVEDV